MDRLIDDDGQRNGSHLSNEQEGFGIDIDDRPSLALQGLQHTCDDDPDT
jgi:hypothetical protein